MLTIYALCVSLSIIAAVNTGSLNISLHLSNDKFVVIIILFRPALKDKLEKSNSEPSLSKDIYPSSSAIIKSYFSNLLLKFVNVFSLLHSFN